MDDRDFFTHTHTHTCGCGLCTTCLCTVWTWSAHGILASSVRYGNLRCCFFSAHLKDIIPWIERVTAWPGMGAMSANRHWAKILCPKRKSLGNANAVRLHLAEFTSGRSGKHWQQPSQLATMHKMRNKSSSVVCSFIVSLNVVCVHA